jgi:hypothetical protein
MCWKHEWAMAINNLQHAIEHTEKARNKLIKRLERNEKFLQRLKQSKNNSGPGSLAPVHQCIEKNQAGIGECAQIIAELRIRQHQLYRLIQVYGIKLSKDPQKVKQLMGRYVPKGEAES